MARSLAVAAAIAVSLLAVSGAGGAHAQTPKRGGTVVVGVGRGDEPVCFGWEARCRTPTLWLNRVLAEPFVRGPDGPRLHVISGFTLSKPPFTVRNPFTVTFHIRREARWSDGAPVAARDFLFAYRTSLKYIPQDDLDWPGNTIRRVRAIGAKTVRFVFRRPLGNWRLALNRLRPLPSHVLSGHDLASVWKEGIDDPNTGRPIASGPFLIGRWERGRQITLVRNPRYWGPHTAHVERVVLRFLTNDERDEALRSGEVDVAPTTATDFLRDPRYRVRTVALGGWEHFAIRLGEGGHPALRKKLVRRALAYGIDRVALVRSLFPDLPGLRPLDNVIYLTSEREYEPNWSIYRYRPGESRRLLEQAGCRRGPDGIYACGGQKLSVQFVTTAGNPMRAQTLALVQAHLRRAGVEVRPVFVPLTTLLGAVGERILPRGAFEVALFAFVKPAPGYVAFPYRCGEPQNFSGYCSRLVTEDLDQLDRIIDADRWRAVANRVDRRLVRDVPLIPLYQSQARLFVRTSVRGVVPNGFGHLAWNAEEWWLAR